MGKKRERNFEMMRTVAMFFIVVYHCLTHGVGGDYGFSTSSAVSISNLAFSDLMLVFSSIAVNLYVMVSGYFLVDLDFKFSRLGRTWFSACFYSFLVTVLFMCLSLVPFSFVGIAKSVFPVSTDAYWFVTQYLGVLILSPFLSVMVRQLTKQQYYWLLVGGALLCLSVIPDFPFGKRFHVAHGNSVWCFAYLFLIAGYIKHHVEIVSVRKLSAAIALVVLLTLAVEIVGGVEGDSIHLHWLDYNGLPFVLSVLMFLLVRQLSVPQTWFCNTLVALAPFTFGVYLIHDHLLVRLWLWKTVALSSQCDKWFYPFVILGLCIMIFLVCAGVDAIKKKMFPKL